MLKFLSSAQLDSSTMKKQFILALLLLVSVPMSFAQQSWNVNLLSTWRDTSISLTENLAYNEVWGFAQDGKEYAVMGSYLGTYFIDITDAKDPSLIQFVPGNFGFASHRDYHDYNGYLYMVADGFETGLQIVDLSYLPDSVSLVYNSPTLIQQCHNIFIDTATARMYACGINVFDTLGNLVTSSLGIYSLKDPELPELLLDYNFNNMYFHDIYVKNDTAFGNNGNDGMFVYDFRDTANPTIIDAVTAYPGKGYNHSGWASEEQERYYFADETSGSDLKVCDISDITDIEVVGTVRSRTSDSLIAHNLIVKDSFLFVAHYNDGLRIFSLKDPDQPNLVGYYDTYLGADTNFYQPYFQGAWGVYPFLPSDNVLVSDRGLGLHVFDIKGLLTGIPDVVDITQEAIFPNPFHQILTIKLQNNQLINSVRLITIDGKLAQEFQVNNKSSQLELRVAEDLPPGMYFVELQGVHHRSVHKLMKM